MKTTTNFFNMHGQKTTGALQRSNERLAYIRLRINEFEKGNPYPLAYLVANSCVKMMMTKQYTNTIVNIKNNLYTSYTALKNGADTIADEQAKDLLQQAVLFLYENGGRYVDARKALRHWASSQKNGWIDTDTVYYEDYNTGDIRRLPSALTCAIDGAGNACTVSSYTVEEVTTLLERIPLSQAERKYLNMHLQGYTERAIAEHYGKALGTVSSTIATAKSKARCTLIK